MHFCSLTAAVTKADASDAIEVIPSSSLTTEHVLNSINFFPKVPPAHLMETKAERHVRTWLKDIGKTSGGTKP